MPDVWICPDCGEIAKGDLCTHCGNSAPIELSGPLPGSTLSLYGYRSPRLFRFYARFLVPAYVLMFLGLFFGGAGQLVVGALLVLAGPGVILAAMAAIVVRTWARRRSDAREWARHKRSKHVP